MVSLYVVVLSIQSSENIFTQKGKQMGKHLPLVSPVEEFFPLSFGFSTTSSTKFKIESACTSDIKPQT